MDPSERNHEELERIRSAIATGEPIDWGKEVALAEIDDIIAESHYTQEAIERTREADERLRDV